MSGGVAIYGDGGERTALVAHALTGTSRVAEWWPGIVGPGKLLDTSRWRVAGIDVPADARATVRDVVREHRRALAAAGIDRFDLVIGGSLGGMQALQWAIDYPESVARAVVIGAHDHQTAMGIAYNAVQREAIAIDPVRGLRLARKIAMLTYKSAALFGTRHGRRPDRNGRTTPDGRTMFDVEGYLEFQGDAFERRFAPARYVALTRIMDSFDVRDAARRAERVEPRFPKMTFVGISSDLLFRPDDVRAAAKRFRDRGYDAAYLELESDHGHDAFLAESEKLAGLLANSLGETETRAQRGEFHANPIALDRT